MNKIDLDWLEEFDQAMLGLCMPSTTATPGWTSSCW